MRCVLPEPQLLVHCDQPPHAAITQSTGHWCTLQLLDSNRSPHASPPPHGALHATSPPARLHGNIVGVRVRVCTPAGLAPALQDFGHELHCPQLETSQSSFALRHECAPASLVHLRRASTTGHMVQSVLPTEAVNVHSSLSALQVWEPEYCPGAQDRHSVEPSNC